MCRNKKDSSFWKWFFNLHSTLVSQELSKNFWNEVVFCGTNEESIYYSWSPLSSMRSIQMKFNPNGYLFLWFEMGSKKTLLDLDVGMCSHLFSGNKSMAVKTDPKWERKRRNDIHSRWFGILSSSFHLSLSPLFILSASFSLNMDKIYAQHEKNVLNVNLAPILSCHIIYYNKSHRIW